MQGDTLMLNGKWALITGSIGGLGLAVAERLAAEGCNLILNGLAPPDDVAKVREDLARRYHVAVLYHGADLTDVAQIEGMMRFAIDAGGVDVLVNNAVVRHFAPVENFPTERWN